MTVVLRHNPALQLNLVEYQGSVTLVELAELARFMSNNSSRLTCDTLNWVRPNGDFHSVSLDTLDELLAQYRTYFEPLKLQILRRSAWLCQSEAAAEHVRHWVSGPDMRSSLSSNVALFETFADAGDWLLLSEAELTAVERGDEFTEVARFEAPVQVMRAASR